MMFYKETNFKDTPIGKIPKDWNIGRLREVLLLLRNGLTAKQNKEGKGYPVTRIETISEEKIDPSKLGYVPELTAKDIEKYKLIEGDILFSHINSFEHIGKTAIYEGMPEFLIHGMNLLLLRSDKSKVHPKFLLYLLRLFRTRKIFWAMSKKAVNQASINQTELGRVRIPLPPLPEQQKIAEILSIADEAIQKTDEIIAKTERLKKGLMQELLTKGIGHKEFKDTEIGRIPKEWRIVKIGNVVKKVIDSPHKMPRKASKGYPFVSVNYVLQFPDHNFYINPKMEGLEYIPQEEYEEFSKRFDAVKGDILYTKWGTPGVAKLINTEEKFIGSCSVALIKPERTLIFPLWLVYILNSSIVRAQIIPYSHTSTRTEIHIGHIKKINIPLPPLSEQQKIAEILSSIDKKLELEREEKARLERIKQGMMDLLLTGKIRVR